jgi:hypothetical protein
MEKNYLTAHYQQKEYRSVICFPLAARETRKIKVQIELRNFFDLKYGELLRKQIPLESAFHTDSELRCFNSYVRASMNLLHAVPIFNEFGYMTMQYIICDDYGSTSSVSCVSPTSTSCLESSEAALSVYEPVEEVDSTTNIQKTVEVDFNPRGYEPPLPSRPPMPMCTHI